MIDNQLPVVSAQRKELDDVTSLNDHLTSKVGHSWRPLERRQQQCLALLDHTAEAPRDRYLSALTGQPAHCGDCGVAARIQRIANGWDLQLWCSTPGCAAFDTSLLNIELKPDKAAPHLSTARLTVWMDLIDRGYLIRGTNFHQPDPECDYGTCGQCAHTSYRNNPALPQVIVNAAEGVPSLLLTDYRGDLNDIWELHTVGYTIAKVPVRRISAGLAEAAAAIAPRHGELSPDDRTFFSLATTALWMRTPWPDFEELFDDPNIRALLSEEIVTAATQRIAKHHAPKVRKQRSFA